MGAALHMLAVSCPETGKPVATGIETDPRALRCVPHVLLRVNCAHCGEVHLIGVRESFFLAEYFDTIPLNPVRKLAAMGDCLAVY